MGNSRILAFTEALGPPRGEGNYSSPGTKKKVPKAKNN